MRTGLGGLSTMGVALLVAGVGGATVAALDATGDNVALSGADGLADVMSNLLAACGTQFSDFPTRGISFTGGGSGPGASQMRANAQQLAPMTRAIDSTESCAPAAPASPGLTSALLIGVDGVAVVANRTTSCSIATVNNLGATAPFTITSDGTPTGPVVGTYTFIDSLDALRVLYFGLTNDGVYNCGGPVRLTLIRQWRNLFSADCAAGNATCAAGLTHAWRAGDFASATDALVAILGGASGLPPKGGTLVGIGTPATVPSGASQKMNPFCNSADANASPPTTSFAGGSDSQDLDPIRTLCPIFGGAEGVCEGRKTGVNNQGDLGVVLPIVVPALGALTLADLYPAAFCGTACTLVAPYRGAQLPVGFRCPNSGARPILGACWMPYAGSASNLDARCTSVAANSKCFDLGALRNDGRSYNLPVVVLASQVATSYRNTSGFKYQFARDARTVLDKTFFRIHEYAAGQGNVPDPAAGQTGFCQQADDASQIGCLVDSDPCSVGVGGREAARSFPGLGSPAVPQPANGKALAINGTSPFAPSPSDPTDLDAGFKNLLQPPGTTPVYPLARRLYAATLFGFGTLMGGERELSQCLTNNSLVSAAVNGSHFFPVPGGVQCLDYPEESANTTLPAPNVQGSGNVALAGCNAGLPGHDACTDPATAPALCGDGVVAIGFGETCDPPDGTTCDPSCHSTGP